MIDGDVIRLIFFALLVVGWVVKAIVDARKQQQERGHRRVPADPASTPPTVPGRVPPPPRARPRRPASEAEEAESVEPAPRPTVADPVRAGEVVGLTGLAGLAMGTLESATAAIAEEGARHQEVLVRRLGGPPGASPRALARAGMLWSEVLGPPRCQRGPHRAPVVSPRS